VTRDFSYSQCQDGLSKLTCFSSSGHHEYFQGLRQPGYKTDHLFVSSVDVKNAQSYTIVTCQPIVGLRNRALLGSRPLKASRPNTRYATIGEAVFTPCRAVPCRAVPCMPSRTAPCVATQHVAMTSHATGVGNIARPSHFRG
jgi:hypothetical protein